MEYHPIFHLKLLVEICICFGLGKYVHKSISDTNWFAPEFPKGCCYICESEFLLVSIYGLWKMLNTSKCSVSQIILWSFLGIQTQSTTSCVTIPAIPILCLI